MLIQIQPPCYACGYIREWGPRLDPHQLCSAGIHVACIPVPLDCGGSPTREWVLTDVADSRQLGTSERMRDKMVKLCLANHSSTAATPVATIGREGMMVRDLEERVRAAKGRAEERVREAEERADRLIQEVMSQGDEREREAERSVREAEQQAQASEARARAAERRVREAEQRAQASTRAAERRVQEAEQRTLASEERARAAERRVREAEQRAQASEERARGAESANSAERQWVVERREIHITEDVLGGGGWGEVKVAKFRGTKVAAKSLYQAIRSGYYRQLFIREMNMASRIRHPNLVQFIGACMEDGMMILTELMPTSLRRELERGDYHMTAHQLIVISLDVAKALNYLHQMQPDPVIHRDISSANVLLEPLPDQQWRAKVTDYGSVNFQRQLRTVGPGSIVYASPEAGNPALQSPKMDIFSFGVLLVEMCTAEFPEVSARERLIASIRDPEWVGLIRRCTHQSGDDRPSADQIIAELQQRLENI